MTQHRRSLSHDAFTECWYVPGELHIVDLIHPDDGLTLHYSDGEAAVLARFAGARRMTCEAAFEAADAAALARYRKDVSEITEQHFMDALNVLPPVGWTTRGGVESFRISERIWGNLTDIYARLGDRYFLLTDDIRLSPAAVAERIAAYVSAHPVPAAPAAADHSLVPPAPAPGDGS